MHFDDRLATVLRARAEGPALARIQFRQLLDLLGALPVEANHAQFDAACERLTQLAARIPPPERAAMLRDPGLRLRNPRLVALLASGEPEAAAAALERAQLSEDAWIDLAPALSAGAVGLLRQRRDLGPRAEALFDRAGLMRPGLPPSGETVSQSFDVAAPNAPEPSGIGAIVQRIEDFRKARSPGEGGGASLASASSPDTASASAPLRPAAFDFATDAEGRIVWADPGIAPMAVGLRLGSREPIGPASASAALAIALRRRQPVRALGVDIAGAPAIAGRWMLDAAPIFDPRSGDYRGHAGRLRRPAARFAAPQAAPAAGGEADRMRQVLHELRTPVNAIQGFAEVIQQQVFGPAPHEYRALAAAIASDAAAMLAGFEELERLARLETGRLAIATDGSDMIAVAAATVAQLRPFTEPRGSGFALRTGDETTIAVALADAELERLIWRVLAVLASAAAPGEVLKLRARSRGDTGRLTMQLPASLAALDDTALLQAQANAASGRTIGTGMFGAGFALRLAMAEARAAGGLLRRRDGNLQLRLPLLTAAGPDHSHADREASSG
jgi:two-component system, OmpR family, sensor kinase